MNNKPLVCIIILNWNGINNTLFCIKNVLNISNVRFKIILLDNGSKDNEGQELLKRYKSNKNIDVLLLKKNLGFTGGVNYGINYAKKFSPDYFLLLNNDTEVTENFLSELIKVAENDKRIALVSPIIFDFNKRDKILYSGGGINWWLARPYHTSNKIDTIREVSFATGCSLLIKNDLIKKLGTLDNRFFAYFEDAALCILAKKNGFKCICNPSSVIYHKESSSSGKKSKLYAYLFSRNRVLFAYHYNSIFLIPYYIAFFTLKLVAVTLYFVITQQSERALAFFRGYIDGIRGKGGVPSI